MKILKFIALSVFAANILVACGGGGGVGSPSSSNQSSTSTIYTLPNLMDILAVGQTINFNLSGNDNQGRTFFGSLYIENQGLVTVSGTNYIRYFQLVQLMSTQGEFITEGNNIYVDPITTEPVYRYSPDTGLTFTVVTINPLPATAHINNSGSLTSYSISDGGSETGAWQLKSNTNPYADLVQSFVIKNSGGAIRSTEDDTYTIDPTGSVKNISIHYYEPDTGYILDVSSGSV